MLNFPSKPEQLTTSWLSAVLDYDVKGFTVAPLGEGVGVIGLVTKVSIDADDGPVSLIAKFPASAPENRGIADTYSMYLREYQFYTQLSSRVPIRAPICYHAEFNHENNDFVLILEDLKGFRLGDQVTGCSVSEAQLVVESLAAFHRNTWMPEGDIGLHNTHAQIAGMRSGFKAGWPVVHQNFPHLVTDEIFRQAGGLHEKVEPLLKKICSSPLCIAHGDVRLDNVFFGETEIALVDFQATCQSAPEHDLAYFITQSLKKDVRNARDWVDIYHELLTSEGIEYSLEQCRERYRLCALYFLCYATVICSVLDLGNERGRLMGETLLENSLQSIEELGALDLLETL